VSARIHAGTGAPHSVVGEMCRWNIPASPAVETEAILEIYELISSSLEDSTQQRSKIFSHGDCRRRNRMMMSRNFNICTRSQPPEARNINAKSPPPLFNPKTPAPSSTHPLPCRDRSTLGWEKSLTYTRHFIQPTDRTRLMPLGFRPGAMPTPAEY